MIADVFQDISVIHLQCVHLFRIFAMIHNDVLVDLETHVLVDLNVREEVVETCAVELLADQEQPVHQDNAFALLVILAIQMINRKVAIYEVNVKSIMIVEAMKFVSNLDEVFVHALMLAVNSNVDQMLCVYQIIIVLHVFVKMDLVEIQMISILVVNHKNVTFHKNAKEILTVVQAKCV